MNKFLFMLLMLPVMGFSLSQDSKVYFEEKLFKSVTMKERNIKYSLKEGQILDNEKTPYLIVSISTWVDQSIFFSKEQVGELLEAINIFHTQTTNLIKENKFSSHYLGFVDSSYIVESVSGMGEQIAVSPQVDFEAHMYDNKFYFKLAPVSKKSVKNKDVSMEAFYMSEEQLKTFKEFLELGMSRL